MHQRPSLTAWIVEDNAKSRFEVSEALRAVGALPVVLASQKDFVDALSSVAAGEPPPDLIVLDLRLPWGEESALLASAISGGVGCLELLRQEPTTKDVSVIIYSAFVNDARIKEELSPHEPLIIVDKIDHGRLGITLESLISGRRRRSFFQIYRIADIAQGGILRLGAIATALIAIAAIIVWLIHQFT